MGEFGTDSTSGYPGALDTDSTSESTGNVITATMVNMQNDAIIAIETELGTDPAGTKTDVKTFLQVEHDTDGTHKFPDGSNIADANNNELIVFQTVASAVNEFDVSNAATTTGPILAATGDDTNIDINVNPKGTGEVLIGGESAVVGLKNLLINGGFSIAQRGTSFTSATTPANSDDTYLLDRWILLSDGNDAVDVSQESSTVPTNSKYAIKFDLETEDKKFGILQVLDSETSIALRGRQVTLSFQARGDGSAMDSFKYGVIEWTGTADSVTSDVVSAWGVQGTTPTLATNWAATAEGIQSATALTTSFVKNAATFTVGASANNVAVFIFSDEVADADVGDVAYIGEVQLEVGPAATSFEVRPRAMELKMAEWYFQRLDYSHSNTEISGIGRAWSTGDTSIIVTYSTKRTTPNVTSSAAATFIVGYGGTTANPTSLAWDRPGLTAVRVNAANTGTPYTQGDAVSFWRDATDTCYIDIDAEL